VAVVVSAAINRASRREAPPAYGGAQRPLSRYGAPCRLQRVTESIRVLHAFRTARKASVGQRRKPWGGVEASACVCEAGEHRARASTGEERDCGNAADRTSRAGDSGFPPNELLEAHGERSDVEAATRTIKSDLALAAVGTTQPVHERLRARRDLRGTRTGTRASTNAGTLERVNRLLRDQREQLARITGA
jgi:hypothetical protein